MFSLELAPIQRFNLRRRPWEREGGSVGGKSHLSSLLRVCIVDEKREEGEVK